MTSQRKPYVAAWLVAERPTPGRPAIVGVIADPVLLTDVFARIAKDSALLPPSLTGDAHDRLAVRVSTREDLSLFASSSLWSHYMHETALSPELGGLRIRVALTESAADRLIIGGLPRNRVPLLVGLLAITSGLLAVALVQLRRERELVRLRSGFISGVSHELRTPLAQIRMFGETLLLNRVRSAEERQRCRGAASVIKQFERLDVLLHDVIDGFEPLARSKRTTIDRRIDNNVVAPVDAGTLRQIVLNLLDNALKYGPPAQTIVVASRLEDTVAVIAIEDEGPGVPDDHASRIWNPFYRVPNDSGATGGTGIGLTIVKQLVDMHRGRVRVESGARGARFVVELDGAKREGPAESIRIAASGA